MLVKTGSLLDKHCIPLLVSYIPLSVSYIPHAMLVADMWHLIVGQYYKA